MLPALGLTTDRAVIPHVDDLGASHGANAAFLELAHRNQVTCGSVMVPGPWFRELAEAAATDPSLDIGVHLTLTSEWDTCRWAPLSTVSRTSGLIDEDGYFWRDVDSLRRHLVPEAAELELRTQIERAIHAGLHLTHLDAHMGAAMLPGLLDIHIRLAREYGLFPVLPRSITWAPNPAYTDAVASLAAQGAPIVDHCRGTLALEPETVATNWSNLVQNLDPGITHLALHATIPGDFTAMSPTHAVWRTAEHAFLTRNGLAKLLAKAGIPTIGTRALQTLWLQSG